MTDKPRTFPLTLDSLAGKPARQGGGQSLAQSRIATPQTATQNAAQNAARGGAPYHAATLPIAPSRAQAIANERAQPVVLSPPRQNPLVSEAVRRAMVARIAKQGVKDQVVLDAMQAVPRHLFMDEALVDMDEQIHTKDFGPFRMKVYKGYGTTNRNYRAEGVARKAARSLLGI